MSKTYSAGIVTAYGAAKRAGYHGTYEDFCRQQAGYAESAATVEQAKNTAVSAASTATAKAGEAATAATAAQTAKAQTEAAASQALTDISTARTAAISAVQTEGQTQTANATAQAQAAATSATTASTKASEASASATSARQSATNAAASATSAASSASAAQGVLKSIPSDYSQMSADVTQLKANLTTFVGCEFITFTNGKYIRTNLNVGDLVDLTPIDGYNTNNYAIIDVQEGDRITINATGGIAGRLWCFIDSTNHLISVSAPKTTVSDFVLVAPEYASKLILNPVTGYGNIFMGENLNKAIDDISGIQADLGDKSNLETLDKTNIVSAINSLNSIVRVIANRDTSWAAIKENVKSGYGEILYPVGTDFSVSCPSGAPYNDIVFTVVNHRVENDEPIMTLLMKHVIYGIQFDAIQAMICPSEPMPAGTYHFKLLDGYDTDYDGGKYVQFTLANALEAGGQIVINWPYNQTWIGKNATVYHAFGTTAVETCVMSEGTGGTYLGVADGTVSILNHTHRGRYGSNNYAESAVREWLDSDGAAGAWQTQKTKFQRPCSYNASKAGFVTYLDPEFVAIVRSGSHPNRTNQAYSTTDKFYLLSNEEVGFTSESGIVCGTVLDFYKEAAQEDKIKYDITSQATARYWWLRLPYPSGAGNERYVSSSGALSHSVASSGVGAAAACEI